MSTLDELVTVGEFLTCSSAEPKDKKKFGTVDEVCTCVGFLFCLDPGHYKDETETSTIEEIATVSEFLTCHNADAVHDKSHVGAVDEMCTCCGFLFCQDPENYTAQSSLRPNERDVYQLEPKPSAAVEEIATGCEFLTCHNAEDDHDKSLVGAVDEMCTCCGVLLCQDPGNYYRVKKSQPKPHDTRKFDRPNVRNTLSQQAFDLDSVGSIRVSETYNRAPVESVHIPVVPSTLYRPEEEIIKIPDRMNSFSGLSYRTEESKRPEEHDPLILIVDEQDYPQESNFARRDDMSTSSQRLTSSYPSPEKTSSYGNLQKMCTQKWSYASPEQASKHHENLPKSRSYEKWASFASQERTSGYGNLQKNNNRKKWSIGRSSKNAAASPSDFEDAEGANDQQYYSPSSDRFKIAFDRGAIDPKIVATRRSQVPSASSSSRPQKRDDGESKLESDTVRAVAPNKFHFLPDPSSSSVFQKEAEVEPPFQPPPNNYVVAFEQQPPFSNLGYSSM